MTVIVAFGTGVNAAVRRSPFAASSSACAWVDGEGPAFGGAPERGAHALDSREAKAFAAAAAAGVAHIVKMSTTKPEPDSPIPWWRAHWRSEQALRDAGPAWTILRPNGISFFLLEHARPVREDGTFFTAAGDGRMALIDADDVGAVAAAVFDEPARHAGAVLDLTGPDAVSYDGVVERGDEHGAEPHDGVRCEAGVALGAEELGDVRGGEADELVMTEGGDEVAADRPRRVVEGVDRLHLTGSTSRS